MAHNNVYMPLSHGILAITAIYCLDELQNIELFWLDMSYGIIGINNVFGMIWYLSQYNVKIQKIYNFTAYCQLLFSLPGITTTLLLQNGYSDEWIWLLVIFPTFLLFCYIIKADFDMSLEEFLILFNLVALGGVSFVKEIYYGVTATIAYIVSHYFLQKTEIQYAPLYNCGFCIFCYYSFIAIVSSNYSFIKYCE